jgi:hypothetical protein
MPRLPSSCLLYRTLTILLCVGAITAAFWLGSPHVTPAADPEEADAAGAESLQADLQAIRNDIAEIRKSVEALREALQQRHASTDSSPVTIRVEAPDGRPLSGFEVEMTTPSDTRRVTATGQSGDDGLGLARDMPYGEYRLSLKHPSGWSTWFGTVTVEVGKPFEQTVIAPDTDERATLTVTSSLDAQAFAGLRFGERREYRSLGAAYGVPSVPEPGEESSDFPQFPTLDSGILRTAAQIDVGVEREIEQPDGESQTWYWRRDDEQFPSAILAGTGRVIPIADYDGGKFNPAETANYFRPEEPPANDFEEEANGFAVGYLTMRPAQEGRPESQWEIVPGRLTVSVKRFLGQAAPDVVKTLNAEIQEDQQVWLEAPMQGSSSWVPRILDLDGWERGDSISFHARKVLDVQPGETIAIELQSP